MEAIKAIATSYQNWSCEKCGQTGTVEYPANSDAKWVMAEAERQHERDRPYCRGRIRFALMPRAGRMD